MEESLGECKRARWIDKCPSATNHPSWIIVFQISKHLCLLKYPFIQLFVENVGLKKIVHKQNKLKTIIKKKRKKRKEANEHLKKEKGLMILIHALLHTRCDLSLTHISPNHVPIVCENCPELIP